MKVDRVNPASLGPAVGYSHGVRAGDLLFIAGQIGGTPRGDGSWAVPADFVEQFEMALSNIAAVLKEAGAKPEQLVEMVIYVKDMGAYRAARKALAPAWRKVLGAHYPAITMVEVSGLFEPGTHLEIRAVAAMG